MTDYEAEFWSEASYDKQRLVETFESNIKEYHPGTVTSNRLSPFVKYGIRNTTCVTYYDYNGPRVSQL